MPIFLDIDTAGLNPKEHSIITVRIWDVKKDYKLQMDCFDKSKGYDEKTLEYLGLDIDTIQSYPDINLVIKELEFLKGNIVIVYNARFVGEFLKEIGIELKLVSIMDVAFFLKTLGKLKSSSQSLPIVYKELIGGKAKTKIEKLKEIYDKLKEVCNGTK